VSGKSSLHVTNFKHVYKLVSITVTTVTGNLLISKRKKKNRRKEKEKGKKEVKKHM